MASSCRIRRINLLQTDPREVRDLMSLHLLGSLMLLAGLPLLLLWHAPAAARRAQPARDHRAGAAVGKGRWRARRPRASPASATLTHDHLFHSTLGLLGIRAADYKQKLDAFAVCRAL